MVRLSSQKDNECYFKDKKEKKNNFFQPPENYDKENQLLYNYAAPINTLVKFQSVLCYFSPGYQHNSMLTVGNNR